jgi:hypothetical protein
MKYFVLGVLITSMILIMGCALPPDYTSTQQFQTDLTTLKERVAKLEKDYGITPFEPPEKIYADCGGIHSVLLDWWVIRGLGLGKLAPDIIYMKFDIGEPILGYGIAPKIMHIGNMYDVGFDHSLFVKTFDYSKDPPIESFANIIRITYIQDLGYCNYRIEK